ncbi:L-aspartate oxidase [Hoyosella sp. G463]|uniref:L-aspartate oxidase n=1 Tax=Lolliginicoccus lacisalsi TaxID=2742202 RepID=A0A927PMB7_9ACTN|nr:L-aspartate oxidase [Lolliginicoccus lacisalsi]
MTIPARDWECAADVVVVGAGIAGLTTALGARERGLRVVVVAATTTGTATALAQGGVAVVDGGDPLDSPGLHVADTIAAGAGLVEPRAAQMVVAYGAAAVATLVQRGARFDHDANGTLRRTMEGGHSRPRIIHAGGDATGAEIQRALGRAAHHEHPGIVVLGGSTVTDLAVQAGVVAGAKVEDATGAIGIIHAPAVVLATGGLGQLYEVTTNPLGSRGDGIDLALRAGAAVADMEFVQFHPTMLYLPRTSGTCPLISEAVRGEGAVLRDHDGQRVTAPARGGDLAPRDIVARAIADRMARTNTQHVYLDARHVEGFAQRFPTITRLCRSEGIEPARDLIPVAPGAHYHCGGISTDRSGRTTVPGLFAVGEVARTGLHGANRLASNSLLEAAVMGDRVAEAIAAEDHVPGRARRRGGSLHRATVEWPACAPSTMPLADIPLRAVQGLMSRHAGVVRDEVGLEHAAGRLEDAWHGPALVARAIVHAALHRRETRGCHTRSDHPRSDPAAARSTTIRFADGMIITDDLEVPVHA